MGEIHETMVHAGPFTVAVVGAKWKFENDGVVVIFPAGLQSPANPSSIADAVGERASSC